MSDVMERLSAALADRYRIERELGAGGMATVYLAHDLKHDRDVAIKVLHPDLGAALGGERFLSEIKTTAKLQHPHILPLLDSGEADSLLYYVMPVVTGETLRARLARERQLPIPEAVRIAREVASALDYAHRQGVVHRDIKPENILLHDGSALVADFGIALAVQTAGGQRMTQTGLSLGTPQYMSPEQAMGEKTIDARSDVYALGAVTYEMLAGDPPFAGSSVQAIVARVLTEKPTPLSTLRDTVPAGVEAAVLQSLAKLPADRFATAAEFATALGAERTTATAAVPSRGATAGRRRANAVAVFSLAVMCVAGGWLLGRRGNASPSEASDVPVSRLEFSANDAEFAYPLTGLLSSLALSPDGTRAVFTVARPGGWALAVRNLDALSARVLPGTDRALDPCFSPDGRWIAFVAADGNLRKIAVDGSSLATLAETSAGIPVGLTWLSNTELVLAQRSQVGAGLLRVSAEGGKPVTFTQVDSASGEMYTMNPVATDAGRFILYTSVRATAADLRIGIVDVATSKARALPLIGGVPLGMIDDAIVYVRNDGALMAARLDRRTLTTSTPIQVGDSVSVRQALAGATLSANGSLLYQQGGASSALVRVGLDGVERPLLDSVRAYMHPRFSPDGRRLVVEASSSANSDIWLADLASRSVTRLTNGAVNDRPEWTPDGRRVLYTSTRGPKPALWWQPLDGSTAPEQLFAGGIAPVREGVMTPDGKSLVYRVDAAETRRDVLMVPVGSAASPTPLLVSRDDEKQMRVSPDGRWLAYVSDEPGREEVFVRSLLPGGGRALVSVNGGGEPLWSRDGRHIFYRSADQVWDASVAFAASPSVTSRRMLFRGTYGTDGYHANYDVDPDGRSFVMVKSVSGSRRLIMVVNWRAELRRRMGVEK